VLADFVFQAGEEQSGRRFRPEAVHLPLGVETPVSALFLIRPVVVDRIRLLQRRGKQVGIGAKAQRRGSLVVVIEFDDGYFAGRGGFYAPFERDVGAVLEGEDIYVRVRGFFAENPAA
jgi:hypothetical protein